MFVVDWIKATAKFLLVDSIVNILGDLFEQPLLMWALIGWGWLCIWAMVFSMSYTLGQIDWASYGIAIGLIEAAPAAQ